MTTSEAQPRNHQKRKSEVIEEVDELDESDEEISRPQIHQNVSKACSDIFLTVKNFMSCLTLYLSIRNMKA